MAPSGLNKQPWYFYVINDRARNMELGKQIEEKIPADIKASMKEKRPKPSNICFYDAPCVIYACTIKGAADYAPFDLGLACENLMLEAEALGLSTVPLKMPVYCGEEILNNALHISPEHQLFAAISVGYRAADSGDVPKERKADYFKFGE